MAITTLAHSSTGTSIMRPSRGTAAVPEATASAKTHVCAYCRPPTAVGVNALFTGSTQLGWGQITPFMPTSVIRHGVDFSGSQETGLRSQGIEAYQQAALWRQWLQWPTATGVDIGIVLRQGTDAQVTCQVTFVQPHLRDTRAGSDNRADVPHPEADSRRVISCSDPTTSPRWRSITVSSSAAAATSSAVSTPPAA